MAFFDEFNNGQPAQYAVLKTSYYYSDEGDEVPYQVWEYSEPNLVAAIADDCGNVVLSKLITPKTNDAGDKMLHHLFEPVVTDGRVFILRYKIDDALRVVDTIGVINKKEGRINGLSLSLHPDIDTNAICGGWTKAHGLSLCADFFVPFKSENSTPTPQEAQEAHQFCLSQGWKLPVHFAGGFSISRDDWGQLKNNMGALLRASDVKKMVSTHGLPFKEFGDGVKHPPTLSFDDWFKAKRSNKRR
jgi:hypothetical protein